MIVINNILDVEAHINESKIVIFDLDDTLYSEKDYVRSGFRQIAALFPQIPDTEETLWDFFEAGKPAIDCFIEKNSISPQLKSQCLSAYRTQEPDIKLYPGVRDMLGRIKQHFKLGLITDGRPEGQRAKIKALKLDDYFDNIIITDEIGGISYRKPHPMSFQLMASYFSAEYSEMCYIGDNEKKDVVGSQSLGIKAILFDNRDGLYSKR